jgi:hypothetical protein
MIFLDFRKEFLVKAAMHAKHLRMKELNGVEAELMFADSLLHELRENKYPEHLIMDYGTQIKAIQKAIKEKKLKII